MRLQLKRRQEEALWREPAAPCSAGWRTGRAAARTGRGDLPRTGWRYIVCRLVLVQCVPTGVIGTAFGTGSEQQDTPFGTQYILARVPDDL